ncbi:DUF5317 domain-containing protein [Kribbella sp. NPDC051718]|uniref:DUF5317 domain-containing protein n=1 Tax=Kribbella sp. NPDC051718 TaxID=3155168 RepID=UPI0034234AC6
MLLVLLVMLLAVAAALLTGGHLTDLADNTLSGLHWLAAAATGQVLGSLTGGVAYPVGLVGSAVCIAVFLRLNLRRPGVALLATGFTCNALVVALNGAMPVSPTTLARAGIKTFTEDPRHELADASTRLHWLGDVVPVALPGLGQAVSPGDVLIAAGAGLLLYAGMGGTGQIPVDRPPSWSDLEAKPSADHPAE